MTDEEASDMILVVKKISQKLESHYYCTSLNITIQDGVDAGQTIEVYTYIPFSMFTHIFCRERPEIFCKITTFM
ncbi:hypothetical protein HZS_1031 [Henneguya salminicola]|nr:hypothetical protein HZS_1031 [Henneguya salminicola]